MRIETRQCKPIPKKLLARFGSRAKSARLARVGDVKPERKVQRRDTQEPAEASQEVPLSPRQSSRDAAGGRYLREFHVRRPIHGRVSPKSADLFCRLHVHQVTEMQVD